MANIDYFKQDASVGDVVTIELTSGKSVNGKVVEISECLIIEKEDGKKMRLLDGIIGGWEILSTVQNTKTESSIEKCATEDVSADNVVDSTQEKQDKKDSQFGLKIIGHIDLSKFEKKKKAFSDVSQKTNSSPVRSANTLTKKVTTKSKSSDNNIDTLKQINKSSLPLGSKLSLAPMGRITSIGPLYGIILDYKSEDTYKFDIKDIIGEPFDFSRNDEVVFQYNPTRSGSRPSVCKVINDLFVEDLINKSKNIIETENGTKRKTALTILNYILKQYPNNLDANELKKNHFSIDSTNDIDKPEVVISADTKKALPLLLPSMSEYECKEKERELDLLIRRGQREECLQQSYDILHKKCPTPKYLKSFLDRIVNTEIALGHVQEAIDALAQLIAYSETQDTKPTNLHHLYISLGRLLKQQGLFNEALKALYCAESLNPGSTGVQNLREQINNALEGGFSSVDHINNTTIHEQETIEDSIIIVSKMLQQDVAYRASSFEDEDNDSKILFERAMESSIDPNKTFELRAQLFLDAASSFYKNGQTDSKNYKVAVANYARFKGNSMFQKLQNSIHRFPDKIGELLAYCDSACDYYTEALGIYNGFKQNRYLQELFLKYLKLKRVSSQMLGGKTPDTDWASGTLKSLQKECISDVRTEDFKVFASTCISVGSAAEGAWNRLAFDKDGIGPFMSKLNDQEYRNDAFVLFNKLEQSNINCAIKTGEFLHGIFTHRQERIKQFNVFLLECLKWQFSQFEMEAFEEEWLRIKEYSDILLATDQKAVSSLNQVISTLKPYAEVSDANRMERLISSQQTLIESIDIINETTTYYGRTFFYQIENQWLRSIRKSIDEKYQEKQPKLQIESDPHFIKVNPDGIQYINFVVSNDGESTADSFSIIVSYNGISEKIKHNKTFDAGKSISLSCPISVDEDTDSAIVKFEVKTNYNGRSLDSLSFEITYEKEDNIPFKSDVPWSIDGTPKKNLFIGRQETLDKLIKHYTSKERSRTCIMYGLTRTGKTSILDYLRENIQGMPLKEKPDHKIFAFSWPFQYVAYKEDLSGLNENRFWDYLIKTSLYDKLPDFLQDIIDSNYRDDNLPEIVGQNDFMKIIDILNDNKIMPLFAIDEFSFVKQFLNYGLLNASFLSILRDLSLSGKACFIYAGTYDIEDLPKNKEYGITGQLVHTWTLPVDRISDEDAEKLIDSWDELNFEPRAKEYIKNLSGCVPYWIQWICLDCGKYALSHNYHHLGYSEVNKVVQILTGEVLPTGDKTITWGKIDIINFEQNQYMKGEDSECAVISCIAYINRKNVERPRGVSIKDMKYLWDKHYVSNEFQQKMIDAIKRMAKRNTLREYTDEGRVVYKLNVDLFRRYWYATFPNISSYLTSK